VANRVVNRVGNRVANRVVNRVGNRGKPYTCNREDFPPINSGGFSRLTRAAF